MSKNRNAQPERPEENIALTSASSKFPPITIALPAGTATGDFSYVVYGKHEDGWVYWDSQSKSYHSFNAIKNGFCTNCVNTPDISGSLSVTINLPYSQPLPKGVLVMFHGKTKGISVTGNEPAMPSPTTNPGERFGLFEINYVADQLDIDITNIDQLSLPFTVESSPAPFPLSNVGIPLTQDELIKRFQDTFKPSSEFHQCLDVTNKQLIAPQDLLSTKTAPDALSYAAPVLQAPSSPNAFENKSYFYTVAETSRTGETPVSPPVFGGFLLDKKGKANAYAISIGWQQGGKPAAYHSRNSCATGLNIYRAEVPAVRTGDPVPAAPANLSDYKLLKSISIADWNKQPGFTCKDDSVHYENPFKHPPVNDFSFNSLSNWFDQPLVDFFTHYETETFVLYQFPQLNGSPYGTLWTGHVNCVSPNKGRAITDQKYVDEKNKKQDIAATWQWGDGSRKYMVLQLVGNAVDPNNYSNSQLSKASGLKKGEFQGTVLNIYFPYFYENAGPLHILPEPPIFKKQFAGGSLPPAPEKLQNSGYSPSEMVFGCSGTFAFLTDPDALAQTNGGLLASRALANIQNIIVSALNRGIAKAHVYAVGPQQYTTHYAFSKKPVALQTGPADKCVHKGTYTYYLAGVLNDGSVTALSVPQTIVLHKAAQVELNWLPHPKALYKATRIYRQSQLGFFVLVGEVVNTGQPLTHPFVDTGDVKQVAPHEFYPGMGSSDVAHCNEYSGFLHRNWSRDNPNGISINSLVYGFPYDDQGSFSTNIDYRNNLPTQVTVTIKG
ncbi:hypothetical protein [Pseudovibrio sp. SCP19]|uniref:hypothetical protein n=1 Tax=Pseudovibrio sp. SCP19 TaxID=3141374 RepID=UPI00333C0657